MVASSPRELPEHVHYQSVPLLCKAFLTVRLFNCEPFRVIALLILTYLAQTVKPLSTMWETWVRSLGREDPLEKELATHSSILAWKIPWTEEPGGLQSIGSQKSWA